MSSIKPKLRIRMIWHDTSNAAAAAAIEMISAPPSHKKQKLICVLPKFPDEICALPEFPDEIWLHIFHYIPNLKTMANCILTSKHATNNLARFSRTFIAYKAVKIIENTLKTMANYLDIKIPTFSNIDTKCMEAVVKFAKIQCRENVVFWLGQYFKICFPTADSFITTSAELHNNNNDKKAAKCHHHLMLCFYPMQNLVVIDCHCDKITVKGQQSLAICCKAVKATDVLAKLFRDLKIQISVIGTFETYGIWCGTQPLVSSLKEETPVYCYETNQWKRKGCDHPQTSTTNKQQIFSNPILSYNFL